jgi:hypothetical protein
MDDDWSCACACPTAAAVLPPPPSRRTRSHMEALGVPTPAWRTWPGPTGAWAGRPVMVKARMGGSSLGMSLVRHRDDLAGAISRAESGRPARRADRGSRAGRAGHGRRPGTARRLRHLPAASHRGARGRVLRRRRQAARRRRRNRHQHPVSPARPGHRCRQRLRREAVGRPRLSLHGPRGLHRGPGRHRLDVLIRDPSA